MPSIPEQQHSGAPSDGAGTKEAASAVAASSSAGSEAVASTQLSFGASARAGLGPAEHGSSAGPQVPCAASWTALARCTLCKASAVLDVPHSGECPAAAACDNRAACCSQTTPHDNTQKSELTRHVHTCCETANALVLCECSCALHHLAAAAAAWAIGGGVAECCRRDCHCHSIARLGHAHPHELRLQRVLRMGSLLSQNLGEAA